jgi:GTP-binding protein LepA
MRYRSASRFEGNGEGGGESGGGKSPENGEEIEYALNLIDTPGHVDFSYEVSRSLAACEGALLIVDAAQGVEAQTLANVYLALDAGLEIIPVINKIDLPSADPERVRREIEEVIGIDASGAILTSAKRGTGISEVLEAIVSRLPPPRDTRESPLRALIFDSFYDDYKGVVVSFRVVDGTVGAGDVIKLMASGKEFVVDDVGVLAPKRVSVGRLSAGDVGFLSASIKAVADARVGDTITLRKRPAGEALPGYKEATPMVYCGLFPSDSDSGGPSSGSSSSSPAGFAALREALGRLQLNDAALRFEPEVSPAMGFGFRCGFLGWVVFAGFSCCFFRGRGSREVEGKKRASSEKKTRREKTHFLSLSPSKKKKASCTWTSSKSALSGSTASASSGRPPPWPTG